MSKTAFVNSEKNLLVVKSRYAKGYLSKSAPLRAKNTYRVSLKELLSKRFAADKRFNDEEYDTYVLPAVHPDKTFRYLKQEAYALDNPFQFSVLPFDIDIHLPNHRENWKDSKEAKIIIKKVMSLTGLTKYACVVCTSRGGIRFLFILEHSVNTFEWRFLYAKLVEQFRQDVGGEYVAGGKMAFDVNDTHLVLDGRTPCSITRVPFGCRGGKQVVDAEYFYTGKIDADAVLPNDLFGKIDPIYFISKEKKHHTQVCLKTRGGYPLPDKNDLPALPEGMKPFSWGGLIPQLGGRDNAIYAAVAEAKEKFVDNMTPQQYFAYFYDAVCVQIPQGGMNTESILWEKITREWYERNVASTAKAKKLDTTHSQNAGGEVFYGAEEFVKTKTPEQLPEYVKKINAEIIETMIQMQEGTAFLSSPAGASKSTAAKQVLRMAGGVLVVPSNKLLNQAYDGLKDEGCRKELNRVLGYRHLIKTLEEFPPDFRATAEKLYDEIFDPLYKEAQQIDMMLKQNGDNGSIIKTDLNAPKNGGGWRIKGFPEWLATQGTDFELLGSKLTESNTARIANILNTNGNITIMTLKKFHTTPVQTAVAHLPPSKMFIFDEIEPEDVLNPDKKHKKNKITVYNKDMYRKELSEEEEENQRFFFDTVQKHKTIFINADTGLEDVLKYNDYGEVNMLGREMWPVLDEDLHIVLCPDMVAGHSPHRVGFDEWSPRALYAYNFTSGPSRYLFSNGKFSNGNAISDFNLKNVIGSNDFNNSTIFSLLTAPTPEQIASFAFAAGCGEKRSRKILFQNRINQILSRNVGYRCFHLFENHPTNAGKKIIRRNKHYLILPKSTRFDELDLIVKTPNVWTQKSPSPPDEVKPYLRNVDNSVKCRLFLYNMPPASEAPFKDLYRKYKIKIGEFKAIINDPTLDDFTFIQKTGPAGSQTTVNKIIRGKNIKDYFSEFMTGYDSHEKKFSEFYKDVLLFADNPHINKKPRREIKDYIASMLFLYGYRLVKVRNIEMVVRTENEDIFRN